MDLLGGYGGSGSESEPEVEPEVEPQVPVARAQPQAAPRAVATAARPPQGVVQNEDEDKDGAKPAQWSNIPAPKVGSAAVVKRVVQFQLPIQQAMLAVDSDSEEEEAARRVKRAKPSGNKSKLLDFLPKPKNDAGCALGGGFDVGGGGRKARSARPAADPFQSHGETSTSEPAANNEAYRSALETEPVHPAMAYMAEPSYAYAPDEQGYGHQEAGYAHMGGSGQHQAQDSGMIYGAAMPPTGSSAGAMQAMRMQQQQQQQQKQPAVAPSDLALHAELANVQFKEISQKELTHVDPCRADAVKGMREALGADFALSLRSEAKGFEGDKLAKRKHQIGTLFHNAKMKELEMLETRMTSVKSKKETQAKYGW